MKTYLANIPIMEDDDFDYYYCAEYEAESLEDAVAIANENEWEYLGEKVCEPDSEEAVEAMIERMAHNETSH